MKAESSVEKTTTSELKVNGFIWNGELYLYAPPAKSLFRSSMVHEVVLRGDIFAIRVRDGFLTIVSGKSEVQRVQLTINNEATTYSGARGHTSPRQVQQTSDTSRSASSNQSKLDY